MIHHRPQAIGPDLEPSGRVLRSAVIDGGLMLSLALPVGTVENVGDLGFSPNAFIRIDSDGQVFLTLPYVEGDHDALTFILLLIAEELEATPTEVHLKQLASSEMVCLAAVPGARAGGNWNAWKPLCEAAATARAMLIAAAARRWYVDARFCHAHDGEVIHTATWRKLRYGELAAEAARIPIPKSVVLKEPTAAMLFAGRDRVLQES
jgi:isoquinoline 1-oxidoreductase subunit beta